MKQYINEVWPLVDNFFLAFNISFIHEDSNQREDCLAPTASTFRPPIGPNFKYEVDIRHKTTIPNNVNHWHVFSDDPKLNRFLQTIE